MKKRLYCSQAITLVELLVTTAIVSMLMMVIFSLVNNVSSLWLSTKGKIGAFQEANAGFEALTRKLSQATLNTYWDYDPPISSGLTPGQYVRQSELHFVCGQADQLLASAGTASLRPTTHAVFFNAPLGYRDRDSSVAPLANILNATGFFINYASDESSQPGFLRKQFPGKYAYRLMEVWQSSNEFMVYQGISSPVERDQLKIPEKRFKWFTSPVQAEDARVLSENIIALVLWPKRSSNNGDAPLTTDYFYDTRAYLEKPADKEAQLQRNQLPPLMQVTMLALDEFSAARLEAKYHGQAELLQPGRLFTSSSTDPADESELQDSLKELEDFLVGEHLTYRLFSSSVLIRQAKWSED